MSGEARSSCVQRNITMFRGFCAMKYAIYAVCVNMRVGGSAQVPQKEQPEGVYSK